jgi:hypothetical protein
MKIVRGISRGVTYAVQGVSQVIARLTVLKPLNKGKIPLATSMCVKVWSSWSLLHASRKQHISASCCAHRGSDSPASLEGANSCRARSLVVRHGVFVSTVHHHT